MNCVWHWIRVSHIGNSKEWTTLKHLLRHADEKALLRVRDPSSEQTVFMNVIIYELRNAR